MNVSTAELRQMANVLITFLESSGHSEIDLDNDYYWFVPRDQQIDVTKEPTDPTIGQVSDDLVELRRILVNNTDATAQALIWLAAIFREVGEAVIAE